MQSQDLLDRISPEQRLLLESTLCEDGRATAAFEQWRRRVDIDEIDSESMRLLPLLSGRLSSIAPDDPVRARTRGIYRYAWAKNQVILKEAAGVAALLQEAGIPVMALKGAALLRYYGDQWGARPMYDVDLLVPTGRANDTLDVLLANGWRVGRGLTAAWVRNRVLPRRHSFPMERHDDLELDLHWHVLARSQSMVSDDAFWSAARPFDLSGTGVVVLDDADLLLHVLAHGARSPDRGYLQWVADATHLLRAVKPTALADRLVERARAHGLLSTVHAAVEAADRVVGGGLVEPLVVELARARSSVRGRVAAAVTRTRTLPGRASAALDLSLVGRPTLFLPYAA